jgi:predicted enzyme related to lactoylglutathione lyase
MFRRYELRTTDTTAARAFYRALGAIDERVSIRIVPLPEQAVARGAPAHWLGQASVNDVSAGVLQMIAAGGEPLGPVRDDVGGGKIALVRDPMGAVVGFCDDLAGPAPPPPGDVVWHQLNTTDRVAVWPTYENLFGWKTVDTLEMGELGTYQTFAWTTGGPAVGGLVDSARTPGIHTHWLFFFGVDDLDAAAAAVNARGGQIAFGPLPGPGGFPIIVADDPQGAAFGLGLRTPG